MLIVVVLLMTAYEGLMVEVVRLNQAGPEWEVPISIVMKLASLEPILTVLFCASIVLVFIFHKRMLVNRTGCVLLFIQLTLCIIGTIFLCATNAFKGQFYNPSLLVQNVFYCVYAVIAILSIITLVIIVLRK